MRFVSHLRCSSQRCRCVGWVADDASFPPSSAPERLTQSFRYRGPLRTPSDIIDRAREREEMLDLVQGGHALRMIGPRRYGKTTLLTQLLRDAEKAGMATALVDLEDVLSIGELVVRIERAYANSLKGGVHDAARPPALEAHSRRWPGRRADLSAGTERRARRGAHTCARSSRRSSLTRSAL